MDLAGILVNKEEIRNQILEKRKSLSSEELRLRSRAIQTRLFNREEFRRAKTIHFYISLNHEVETTEMIGRALEMRKQIVVPYSKDDESEIGISLLEDLGRDVRMSRRGFQEPFGPFIRPINPSQVQLWVIPGVAFDLSGNRIGYGKGFYDRLLARPIKGDLTGIAFDFQLLDTIPAEAHDIKMIRIITEYRTVEINE